MKITKDHILTFFIYLIGLNLYFSFWYLGSEGHALSWQHDAIDFFQIWCSANLAGTMTIAWVLAFRNYIKRWRPLKLVWTKIEFGFQLFTGTLLFAIVLILACSILTKQHLDAALGYTLTTNFLSLNIYHLALFLTVSALLNLNQRFGGIKRVFGYVFRWIYPPMDVEKGFMFLDLNQSTRIAERLKSEVYSALLRDCFRLLDEVVEKENKVYIYQYVGDEAILHWDYRDEELCWRAIHIFQRFKNVLEENSNYFLKRYRLMPTFKAAVHGGLVTQSEIGYHGTHTAFHGDVVNTTSRILGLCHQNQTDFLISATYYDRLGYHDIDQYYKRIDDLGLNGKLHTHTVYKRIYPRQETSQQFFLNYK